MSSVEPLILSLTKECCGFFDENEAFTVQYVDDGRLVCYCYGKEAFCIYFVVVDSFYGTKKIVITELNKIDDELFLLSLDSYVLRTFHAGSPHTVSYYQLNREGNGHTRTGILTTADGVVQRIRRQNDWLLVVLRVHEEIVDEIRKSTEFRIYQIGEWETPIKRWKLVDSSYSHLDFPHVSSNLTRLHFFHGLGRAFHVGDFKIVSELTTEPQIKVEDQETLGLTEIFEANVEHLAKNESGVWHNDSFYLYTTPNPAVVSLEHYFLILNLETKQWQRLIIDSAIMYGVIELHMTINSLGVMVLDCRTYDDQRTIHRLPLDAPEPLVHIAQFAVNRKHGNLADMSEEERRKNRFPTRLPIAPAFNQDTINYSMAKRQCKVVIPDEKYGGLTAADFQMNPSSSRTQEILKEITEFCAKKAK
ncbi:hypothetical protein M3Y96_00426800 [Aphelenchoides besseyi]|nr:hypothetical protein M3Y96_00426800 [Aphelenchoides besseyi]